MKKKTQWKCKYKFKKSNTKIFTKKNAISIVLKCIKIKYIMWKNSITQYMNNEWRLI